MSSSVVPIQPGRPEAERIEALADHLQRLHKVNSSDIRVVRAPLRICPLGAHIDHQLGQVTGTTIDRSILLAFASNADRTVHIVSENFSPPVLFHLDDVPQAAPRDWGNYIRGAVLGLQQKNNLKRGLTAVIGSDMPIGGLSSSAAVTIAYLLAMEAVNDLELTSKENINLVRFTENQYIGLNNGILDQSVILFSKRNHLIYIDCQSIEVKPMVGPLKDGDFEILVVYSGLTGVLESTDYNNRVAECREAARRLLTLSGQIPGPDTCLRQVDPAVFAEEGRRLPPNLQRRAGHYFGEIQRVNDGLVAWQQGDLNRLGALMTASGETPLTITSAAVRN